MKRCACTGSVRRSVVIATPACPRLSNTGHVKKIDYSYPPAMATRDRGGRQGKTGEAGRRGSKGTRGGTGPKGKRGDIGMRGPKGLRGLRGPLQQDRVLDRIVTHFDDVYIQLTAHLKRIARMQLQLDRLTAIAEMHN